MKINRIKLVNWRNFPKLDVMLLERVFIIGPNASGKSNFLDAFRFLRDIAQGQGGGLQQAIKNRGGLSEVRCYAARTNPLIEIEVYFGDEQSEEPYYIYKLWLGQEPRGLHRTLVKYEEVIKNGVTILKRPDIQDKDDVERLTETHLEQTSSNKEFREIAAFFNNICYLHIVPQMVRTSESATNTKSDDPFGRSFLERLAKTPDKTREVRLKRMEQALKIIAPQLTELGFDRDEKGQPHLVARYEHWRPKAGKQNEAQFSDGTLRAIGLLWTLQESGSMLLIEEPELSLNNEIVKQLPQMIAKVVRKNKRQMLISTHSYELLSDKGIAPEETLILKPEKEGTVAKLASQDKTIINLVKAGMSMAEIALPMAAPQNAVQLSLKFDNGGN